MMVLKIPTWCRSVFVACLYSEDQQPETAGKRWMNKGLYITVTIYTVVIRD